MYIQSVVIPESWNPGCYETTKEWIEKLSETKED